MRVVLCSNYPPTYRLVAGWAAQHGHTVILLLTAPPDGGFTRGGAAPRMPVALPAEQDILVTTRLASTAASTVAALQPDLLISATFPRLIPDALAAVPRLGAVNLHLSPLPRGRGPNPARTVYDGDPTVGVTLHWLTAEFDTGAILARAEEPVPTVPTAKRLRDAWARLQRRVLELGIPRAAAGQPGQAQDESLATYAPRFTTAERWLDWNEPVSDLLRRVAALGVYEPAACACVGDQPMRILRAHPAETAFRGFAVPGTVLSRRRPAAGDGVEVVTVQAADGALIVRGQRLRECLS